MSSARTARLLCLDFDGVLCNSMDECMLVAFNAWFGSHHAHAEELPDAYREVFRHHRYLVRDPGEYYLLVNLYRRGGVTDGPAFSESVRREAPACAAFKPKFFAARHVLRSGDTRAWLALHPPYKESVDFLKQSTVPVCIITTKDEESVRLLLREYGVAHRVARVYGQETLDRLGGKANAVRDACRQAGVEPSEAAYLDDHLQHLADVRPTGVHLWHATWGYTDPSAPPAPDGVRTLTPDRIREILTV